MAPPLAGTAANCIGTPSQFETLAAFIVTTGNSLPETFILTKSVSDETGAQLNDELIIILTTSLLFNVEVVKMLSFVPAGFPFTVHIKTGLLPAFTALAVKIIVSPWQMKVEGDAATVTPGLTAGETFAIM